jgi:hypothetical protein
MNGYMGLGAGQRRPSAISPPKVNGFFHRRSPVLLHGVLHTIAEIWDILDDQESKLEFQTDVLSAHPMMVGGMSKDSQGVYFILTGIREVLEGV